MYILLSSTIVQTINKSQLRGELWKNNVNAQLMTNLSYITFCLLSLTVQIQHTTTIQYEPHWHFICLGEKKFLFEFLDDITMGLNFYAIVLKVVKSMVNVYNIKCERKCNKLLLGSHSHYFWNSITYFWSYLLSLLLLLYCYYYIIT